MDLRTAQKRIMDAGRRQGWWNSAGVVAALSGGGDSVALLWLLKTFFKGRLVAAHLDHCTRKGASHEDASFCESLCKEWNIRLYVKRVDVYSGREKGESFEMAGRRERYEHFFSVAGSEDLPYVALGHSADDVVETQLMNLFRGTGLVGLRGIPEARRGIVRPVIGFRREELRSLLRGNGVEWREDASNSDTVYLRNKVREELLPWIHKHFNPNFESGMLGLAAQIDEELRFKQKNTQNNLEKVTTNCYPALVCWSAKKLKDFTDLELADMIRAQAKQLGLPTLSRDRTNKLLALFRKGGQWRFQWVRDIEVCYSGRGIGWLRRADIERALSKGKNDGQLQAPWWAK